MANVSSKSGSFTPQLVPSVGSFLQIALTHHTETGHASGESSGDHLGMGQDRRHLGRDDGSMTQCFALKVPELELQVRSVCCEVERNV